ncbi:glutamine amidotransferase [Loktanella sp. IMCC34160]|uniref:glutamine amidotransferase-related protein n=1 Tax=Loktanella sp. IMCC34160 TaxID=2510646 RepID=UPI00101C9E62|nr:glutamine amidotransferase [Loktanella sp. IMCC34160]RYG90313.1 glutamine amidotransferase [Loktanella sp. IMCC34160]
MRVVSVRHGDEPLDDRITTWLSGAGYAVEPRRPYLGEILGQPTDDVAATVIYGGPYNAFDADTHAFLKEEYRWIEACMAAGIKVLGICQGAQMIAHHLGAWAGPRDPEVFEFGYYPIRPTSQSGDFLTKEIVACQAHFHTFDLPAGAVRLASGDTYENQAFRYGDKTYGLQFHAEVTRDGFRRWQVQKTNAYGRNGVQPRAEQDRLAALHDAAQADWFHGFLGRFFGDAA